MSSSELRRGVAAIVVMTLAVAGAPACGRPSVNVAVMTRTSAHDELVRHRARLEQMRRSPFAAEATVEIARAESWLNIVELRLARQDEEGEHVRVLLRAAEGQLMLIQSLYARRTIEQETEDVRSTYVEHVGATERAHEENEQTLEQEESLQ